MTSKYAWSGVLVVSLSVALSIPANTQGFPSGQIGPSTGPIIAAIIATGAGLVVATVVVVHYSKKRAITGCVISSADRITLTDEKDQQIYLLSGDTTAIKPGDRMKLRGKKVKPKAPDKTPVWQAETVTKDYGACPP